MGSTTRHPISHNKNRKKNILMKKTRRASSAYKNLKGQEIVCGANDKNGKYNADGKGVVCGYKDQWLILGFDNEYEGCIREFTDGVFLDEDAKNYKSFRFYNVNNIKGEEVTLYVITSAIKGPFDNGIGAVNSEIFNTKEEAEKAFDKYKKEMCKQLKKLGYEWFDYASAHREYAAKLQRMMDNGSKTYPKLKLPEGVFGSIEVDTDTVFRMTTFSNEYSEETGGMCPKEISPSITITLDTICHKLN